MDRGLDPAAERERGGGERGGLLSDEEPGLTGCLDRGLLDGGNGCVEFFDGGCGDGDEAGEAEDAVGLNPFRRSSRYESRPVARGRGQGDWSDHDEQQEASHPGAGRP